MSTTRPSNVDEFIKAQPAAVQPRLRELRATILAALPNAHEEMKWNQPAYVDDVILVIFSAYRNHASLVVTPSTKQAFEDKLTDYTTGKGSVNLPYDQPLPTKLITDMVKYRLEEYKEHHVNWK